MTEIWVIEEEVLCDSVQYYCDASVRIDDIDDLSEDTATYTDREY